MCGDGVTIDDLPAAQWAANAVKDLGALPGVTLRPRTTAFGYYDGNLIGALERVAEHLAVPPPHAPRQRFWMIRAKAVVLASGAHERGIVYANNDVPGTLAPFGTLVPGTKPTHSCNASVLA